MREGRHYVESTLEPLRPLQQYGMSRWDSSRRLKARLAWGIHTATKQITAGIITHSIQSNFSGHPHRVRLLPCIVNAWFTLFLIPQVLAGRSAARLALSKQAAFCDLAITYSTVLSVWHDVS